MNKTKEDFELEKHRLMTDKQNLERQIDILNENIEKAEHKKELTDMAKEAIEGFKKLHERLRK